MTPGRLFIVAGAALVIFGIRLNVRRLPTSTWTPPTEEEQAESRRAYVRQWAEDLRDAGLVVAEARS